jgi:hypothetical protein
VASAHGKGRGGGRLQYGGERVENHKIGRTVIYEDENGQRIPVGFDEAYQRNPRFLPISDVYDPATDGRWASYFPPGISAMNNNYTAGPSYLIDAWDTIYVRNEDGGLDEKTSMNDFMITKTFIKDPGLPTEEEVERESLGLFVLAEDTSEWGGSDYSYHDFNFSIYVAPDTETMVTPEVNVANNPKHWWERDEVDGLTGEESFAAVGVNMQPDVNYGEKGRLSDAELRSEHFGRFRAAAGSEAGIVEDGAWTMHGNGTDDTIDFPRAVLTDANGVFTGVLNTEHKVVKRFLDLADEEGKPRTFYYTKDDLVDYIQMFVGGGDPVQRDKWYDPVTQDWKYDLAAVELKALNTGGGYTLEPVAKRWEDRDGQNNIRTERAALTKTVQDERGALAVSRDPKLLRKLAADILGSSVESVPVIRTDGFRPLPDAAAQSETLGFIAGELKITGESGYDMLTQGIRSDPEGVPIRSDILTFPEPDVFGDFRKDYAKAYFAEAPFDMNSQSDMDAAAKQAVEMCYQEYYDPRTKQDMQSKYSIKEHRYSLGFHRNGKKYNDRDPYAQDRLEIIGLGVKTFNPFRTTDGGGVSFIASEPSGDPADPVHTVVPNYPTNEDAEGKYAKAPVTPTFVFDKPIDGAGALIVNGNLHIKSTFAYYGILVVLGDLIVEPSLHAGEFVCNSEGRAVDKFGNAVFPDRVVSFPYQPGSVGWSYDNPATSEDEESILAEQNKEMMGVPEPSLQDVHRGALILQGTVAVKGRVVTKKTVDGAGGEYGGIFDAYWNRQAVEDVGGVISRGRPAIRRLVWASARQGGVGLADVDTENIWLDRTDVGHSTYVSPAQ